MEVRRVEIPSRKLEVEQAAGKIVIAALQEAGINPRSEHAQRNVLLRELLGQWGRREISRA